jgi:DNA anti-recombination protein RmuC
MATTTAASNIAAKYEGILNCLDNGLPTATAAENDKRAAVLDKLLTDVTAANYDFGNALQRFKAWQNDDKLSEERLGALEKITELLNQKRADYEKEHGPELLGILETQKKKLEEKLAREEEEEEGLKAKLTALEELIHAIQHPRGKKGHAKDDTK